MHILASECKKCVNFYAKSRLRIKQIQDPRYCWFCSIKGFECEMWMCARVIIHQMYESKICEKSRVFKSAYVSYQNKQRTNLLRYQRIRWASREFFCPVVAAVSRSSWLHFIVSEVTSLDISSAVLSKTNDYSQSQVVLRCANYIFRKICRIFFARESAGCEAPHLKSLKKKVIMVYSNIYSLLLFSAQAY